MFLLSDFPIPDPAVRTPSLATPSVRLHTTSRQKCGPILALAACILLLAPARSTPNSPRSATQLVRDMEDQAGRDMAEQGARILNWSPYTAHKYSDAMLGIEAYRRPRLRGVGGLMKGR
jgi:hypothetical protein